MAQPGMQGPGGTKRPPAPRCVRAGQPSFRYAFRQTQDHGRTSMMDRRTFSTMLAGSAATTLLPQFAWAQGGKTVYYASVGGELTLYSMDVGAGTLTKVNSVTLPANVQYAWPHPN